MILWYFPPYGGRSSHRTRIQVQRPLLLFMKTVGRATAFRIDILPSQILYILFLYTDTLFQKSRSDPIPKTCEIHFAHDPRIHTVGGYTNTP